MIDVMDINQKLLDDLRSISDDNSDPKKGEIFYRRNGAWVTIGGKAEVIDTKDGQVLFIETPFTNDLRVPVSCTIEHFIKKFARVGNRIDG